MEILKISTDWAKDEVFSSQFFILFGIMFIIASIGFWQLGKSEIAQAFIYPTLVAGLLLLTIGVGLFIANKSRITSFTNDYNSDPSAFVAAEIDRTAQSMKEYQTIVFKIIPILIMIACLLIIFIDKANWRAISTTTIAMMVVILMIDNNANGRIETYNQQLIAIEK